MTFSLSFLSTGQYVHCPMTPVFTAWSSQFTSHLARLRRASRIPMHPFQQVFGRWICEPLLSQEDQGVHSRCRHWPLRLTFWTFLWQTSQPGASCREAVLQAGTLRHQAGLAPSKAGESAYCQARTRIPMERLTQIHERVVREGVAAARLGSLWCGRRVRVVDGTTVTLADTPTNQRRFPQQSVQKPGCGFPLLRLLGLFCLSTGLVVDWVIGNWHDHELQLLNRIWESLAPGEVLLADRGFCNYGTLARARTEGIDVVVRARGSHRSDFRRGQRLGPEERLVRWAKSVVPARSIPRALWDQLPEELSVRLVRCRMGQPGFRSKEVVVVTTLLDPERFPADQISALYLRRWEMELCLRSLKTTLQMEHLSSRSPEAAERELCMHLLVHNLVRRLVQESASIHQLPATRLSFAGALASARRTAEALHHPHTPRKRRELYEALLEAIAFRPVPLRPGRREPRARKRRPKPFPLLSSPRSIFQEIRHQNRYYVPKKTPVR